MPKPIPLELRRRYHFMRACLSKKRYVTYGAALEKGSRVYACDYCMGFHRTSKTLKAEDQIKLIERIFGCPITPEAITKFNEWVPPGRK